MKRLLVATLNPGKIREFAHALTAEGIEAFAPVLEDLGRAQ